MRTTCFSMVAALLFLSGGAAAQDTTSGPPASGAAKPAAEAAQPAATGDVPLVNSIDFGVRGTLYNEGSDKSRYQRYRDLSNGATLDRFRFFKETKNGYALKAQADHVGYEDQRFLGSVDNYGKLKASFEWNQVPLWYSDSVRTLYTSSGGTLTIPDNIQLGIQSLPNKTQLLDGALDGVSSFDLRTRRDIANVNLTYSANQNVDVAVVVRNTQKTGAYPFGGSFGIGSGVASEMPVPVDHRTTDLTTSLEYASGRLYGRLAYDGSFFRNNISAVTFDNPARATDSATLGPVAGRIDLWPNTNMNTVSASGGFTFAGHSRANAYVSIGDMSNNDPLLPYTINTALASPALSRPTADVTARVTTMNYSVTSRPTSMLWFSARYRQYEFNNKTEPFVVGNSVNYDTAIVALNKESEPFGQTRHTFDADASFSPVRYLGFKAGYTREEIDRTFRIVENTTEDIGRVSVDLTGTTWLTVRGVFEHGKRRGSAVDQLELLAIGEQPTLRQYDISDRDQDRFSALVVVTPVDVLSLNLSASTGRQEYPGTNFGLRNNDNHIYTVGFDFVPTTKVSLGASYSYEKYTALQASRTANPLPANTLQFLNDPTQQFNDPRRDWTDDSADKTDTIAASADFLKLIPRMDIRLVTDYSKSRSTYVYGLAPNTTLAAPLQLTPVVNELFRGIADARYFLTRQVAVGAVYLHEEYRTDDFALGPVASLAQPATAATPTLMMLGYFWRPYTSNTVMARLTYLW